MNRRVSTFLVGGFFVCLITFLLWMFRGEPFYHTPHRDKGGVENLSYSSSEHNNSPKLPSLRDLNSKFGIDFQQRIAQSKYLKVWGIVGSSQNSGPLMEQKAAEALGIIETERLAINQALKDSFTQIKKLQRDNVVIISQTESELHLKIKAFPQQGQKLRERLQAGITGILGEDRGPGIWELIEPKLEEPYRKFGEADRILIGRSRADGYNEVEEDGLIRGFPFSVSFDSMQQNLFNFEDTK